MSKCVRNSLKITLVGSTNLLYKSVVSKCGGTKIPTKTMGVEIIRLLIALSVISIYFGEPSIKKHIMKFLRHISGEYIAK